MVFKRIICQNRYVALETPSRPPPPQFMAKTILNFHFDYPQPSLTITWDLKILCDSLRQGINKLHKPLAEVWDGLSAHFHSPLLFVAIDTAAHELGLGWSITWSHIHTWCFFFSFPSSKCVNCCIIGHCTMLPLSTKSCSKSSKLRPIWMDNFVMRFPTSPKSGSSRCARNTL